MIPLDKTILYSANSYPNRYWTPPRNTTEWNVFMGELVATGNELQRLKLAALAPTLKGAHLGTLSYSLKINVKINTHEVSRYI